MCLCVPAPVGVSKGCVMRELSAMSFLFYFYFHDFFFHLAICVPLEVCFRHSFFFFFFHERGCVNVCVC